MEEGVEKEEKDKVVSDFRRHDDDNGSLEVQIALLSTRITEMALHLKDHEKDFNSRKALSKEVAKRNTLLKTLSRHNRPRYTLLAVKLGLIKKRKI